MSKRSESMQKIASLVKNRGHENESLFNSLFGDPDAKLSYTKNTPDCMIHSPFHKEELTALGPTGYSVSLKSGNTWQFNLGEIPELTMIDEWKRTLQRKAPASGKKAITKGLHGIEWNQQKAVLRSKGFWNKYLKKGDLLCYYDKKVLWTFFNMDQVISFITEFGVWRLIESSGRIKGDFFNQTGQLIHGIITYEYRSESHKETFVLGAHGGTKENANGYRLHRLLLKKIPSSSFNSQSKAYSHLHP